jgi:hypothetical protein
MLYCDSWDVSALCKAPELKRGSVRSILRVNTLFIVQTVQVNHL